MPASVLFEATADTDCAKLGRCLFFMWVVAVLCGRVFRLSLFSRDGLDSFFFPRQVYNIRAAA